MRHGAWHICEISVFKCCGFLKLEYPNLSLIYIPVQLVNIFSSLTFNLLHYHWYWFWKLFYFPLIFIFNILSQLQAKNGIQEMECCSLESDWIYFHPDASGRIIHVGPNQVKWVFSLVTLKLKVAFGSIYWQLYFCQLTTEPTVGIISCL